jgi:hypothetical protein
MKISCLKCKHRGTDFYFGCCNIYTDEELQDLEKAHGNKCCYFEPAKEKK